MSIGRSFAVAVMGIMLAGCAENAARQTELAEERNRARYDIGDESILDLFRRSDTDPERSVGVNRFLWAAALDTLSFLPLEAADPFTGVIATDWGVVSGDPTPYRVTVLITDPALDARSLRVSAFRQQGGRAVAVSDEDNRRIEDAILTRARQLRIAEGGR
ncbi:MAG TPA: DUF3576 domain-containing protein [Paracoccaceae bacterium]|nr:DUF3576 domain-containing protein [Paracoccaceae bacterium]